MLSTIGPQPPYPIHKSVKDKLDVEYVKFYNEYIINNQQVHYQPVEESRTSGTLIPGGGPLLPVGTTVDFAIQRKETTGPDVAVRCFTPEGERPENGWPVMLYYHGGGWVLGNINTENTVCTNMCNRAKVVVVSVDYRLAPENPWPAAVHDSWEALLWIHCEANPVSLDRTRVAIGGSSAGGNLGAIMVHKAIERSLPAFKVQLLIVPVTDNTASTSNNSSYKSSEFTAALPAEKMLWYRRHYLPNESDWTNPEASPLLYNDDWSRQPPALIVVGELDVLRTEGEQYAQKLKEAGVKADLRVMKGMPHPFLAMDGVLQAGKDAITYMCEALKSTL